MPYVCTEYVHVCTEEVMLIPLKDDKLFRNLNCRPIF